MNQSMLRKISQFVLIAGMVFSLATVTSVFASNSTGQQGDKVNTTRPPIACKLGALDKTQRERQTKLRDRLHKAVVELKELPDGYAFKLNSKSITLLDAAEWITLESACCPFFNFGLEANSDRESIWLRLTGRDGVKQFIKAEMLGKK
jgi:hypothetical protein